MRSRVPALPAIAALLLGSAVATETAQPTASPAVFAPLACNPDQPLIWLGEKVDLKAWAHPEDGVRPRITWRAAQGRIVGAGPEVTWDLADATAGMYEASARLPDSRAEDAACSLQVRVEDPAGRGMATGWSLLMRGRAEQRGYGLYSYVLLGARPTDQSRARYLSALEAYVTSAERISALTAAGIAARQLNATYVPVTRLPGPQERPPAQWLLDSYDYARAREILTSMPGDYRGDGPYIISTLAPLSGRAAFPNEYLYQDLSIVAPRVVRAYAQAFFNQAAQPRFWEPRTAARLSLGLRTTLAAAADGLPQVQAAVKDLIRWVRS
jgi:hypothetical protein